MKPISHYCPKINDFLGEMTPKGWGGKKTTINDQIQLNQLLDDHHFGYITKLKKRKKEKRNYNHDTMATSTPTILFSEIFKHSQKKKEKKIVKRKKESF